MASCAEAKALSYAVDLEQCSVKCSVFPQIQKTVIIWMGCECCKDPLLERVGLGTAGP